MNTIEAKKALLTCPGDTMQETMDELGISRGEMAKKMAFPLGKLTELIEGKAVLTKEIALSLETILGVPANFWLNIEQRYRDEILEIGRMESTLIGKEQRNALR